MLNYQGCKVLHIPILQKSTAHNGNYSHLTLQFSIITFPYSNRMTFSKHYKALNILLCIFKALYNYRWNNSPPPSQYIHKRCVEWRPANCRGATKAWHETKLFGAQNDYFISTILWSTLIASAIVIASTTEVFHTVLSFFHMFFASLTWLCLRIQKENKYL